MSTVETIRCGDWLRMSARRFPDRDCIVTDHGRFTFAQTNRAGESARPGAGRPRRRHRRSHRAARVEQPSLRRDAAGVDEARRDVRPTELPPGPTRGREPARKVGGDVPVRRRPLRGHGGGNAPPSAERAVRRLLRRATRRRHVRGPPRGRDGRRVRSRPGRQRRRDPRPGVHEWHDCAAEGRDAQSADDEDADDADDRRAPAARCGVPLLPRAAVPRGRDGVRVCRHRPRLPLADHGLRSGTDHVVDAGGGPRPGASSCRR